MSCSTHDDGIQIPPPEVVRAELARSVREARRLRSLLRLAVQADEDRRYLRSLAGADRQATPGRAVDQ